MSFPDWKLTHNTTTSPPLWISECFGEVITVIPAWTECGHYPSHFLMYGNDFVLTSKHILIVAGGF